MESKILKKRCTKCKKLLPLPNFGKNSQAPDKLHWHCRRCISKREQRYKARTIAYSSKYRAEHKQEIRNDYLKRQYGITLADYTAMKDAQSNVCAICHKHETVKLHGKTIDLCVDHCHTTGKIRGLLCKSCNTTLYPYEDMTIVKGMLLYLYNMEL
jgi:hypothetical protein